MKRLGLFCLILFFHVASRAGGFPRECARLTSLSDLTFAENLRPGDLMTADGQVIFRPVLHPLRGYPTNKTLVIFPQSENRPPVEIDLKLNPAEAGGYAGEAIEPSNLRISKDQNWILGTSDGGIVVWNLKAGSRTFFNLNSSVVTKAASLLESVNPPAPKSDEDNRFLGLPYMPVKLTEARFLDDGRVYLSGFAKENDIASNDYIIGFKVVMNPALTTTAAENEAAIKSALAGYQGAIAGSHDRLKSLGMGKLGELGSYAGTSWIPRDDILIEFGYSGDFDTHPYETSNLVNVTAGNRLSLARGLYMERVPVSQDRNNDEFYVRVLANGKVVSLKNLSFSQRAGRPLVSTKGFDLNKDIRFIISPDTKMIAAVEALGRTSGSGFSIDLWETRSGAYVASIPLKGAIVKIRSQYPGADDFTILGQRFSPDGTSVILNMFFEHDGKTYESEVVVSLTSPSRMRTEFLKSLVENDFVKSNAAFNFLKGLVNAGPVRPASPFELLPPKRD